jgi:LPS O-antigen subunit length determinant protein (WzzB/FepE family)
VFLYSSQCRSESQSLTFSRGKTAKRRRLDGLDKETAERLAAREAARAQFLSDLEAEMQLVEQHTHPLLDLTYRRLQEEKKQKFAQLRRYQEEREQQLARSLEAANRANWDNWSVRVGEISLSP